MPSPELCIVTLRRLDLGEWQRAIDSQGFFTELRLDQAQPEAASGRWSARLAEQPVIFAFTERPVAAVLGRQEALGMWRHAFVVPGSGDLARCAAGGMALLAYAVATDGAISDPEAGTVRTFGPLREALDAMSAVASGKAAEYEALHPSPPAAGSDDIITFSHIA